MLDRVLPSATVVGDIATGGDGDAREGRGTPDRETSTRRSLEVLLSLGSDAAIARGGLGVTRIAEMLGREKSQVSRTLKTLADFGLVDRDPDTLAYRLGWRIYALASLAGERRLLDDARPVLRRLVDDFEERAFLSVLQGADTLTILSESSDYAVQAIGWVGRVSPAYCTSVGQALLLDHDRPALERLFRDTEFRRLGPNTVRNVKELARRIDAARERGYAIADEELELGLVSAAVPVRDGAGRIVAAVNVSAPKFRFGERLHEAGTALMTAAQDLGATLSGSQGRAAS